MTTSHEPGTLARMIALLRGLRAIRAFTPDPVPQPALDDILEVARWTGSAMNRQPWALVVVRERATLDALADAGGYVKHLASASAAIVLTMDTAGDTFDEGRLAERVMLAAAAHGLGAGPAWFNDTGEAAAKQLLGIPATRLARTVIALGTPAPEARAPRTKPGEARKPLNQVAHHERW